MKFGASRSRGSNFASFLKKKGCLEGGGVKHSENPKELQSFGAPPVQACAGSLDVRRGAEFLPARKVRNSTDFPTNPPAWRRTMAEP